jgi:tRNA1Val (adenine37-N6)-methyltransferase
MKVCTDACIQGAYAAAWLNNRAIRSDVKDIKILDIGTGTGLLTLMLAQEISSAYLDAIELDTAACRQAGENFIASPWADRIRIFQGDIRTYPLSQTYDFIICNPPFYENDLKSAHQLKNQAKHEITLDSQALLHGILSNLSPGGSFCVMFPVKQFSRFRKMAEEYLFYPEHVLHVRHTAAHSLFRSIGCFTREKGTVWEEEFCMMDKTGNYTPAFKSLLDRYYLHL